MTTEYVAQSIEAIGRGAGLELLPHAIRLLSQGEPVPLERLAAAIGWPLDDVEAALDAQPGTERDDEGRLVGPGLSLRATQHRFTVGGRTLFAWCASDALHSVAEAFRLDREVVTQLGWDGP